MGILEGDRGVPEAPPTMEKERLLRFQRENALRILDGGAISTAFLGGAAIALAILALAGLTPLTLTSIGIMVLGAAMLLKGESSAFSFARALPESYENYASWRGTAAEVGGGLAAIILGLLALVGVMPVTLHIVAVLVLGAALFLGALATWDLDSVAVSRHRDRQSRRMILLSALVQAVLGVTAIILGVVAFRSIEPETLSRVAILGIGVSLLLTGLAVGRKLARHMFH